MQPSERNLNVTSGTIFGLILLAIFICGRPAPARAIGFGPYIDFSGGSGELEWERSNFDFDVDTGSAAIGLAFDTAPIGRSYFSYRMNIGFEGQNLEDNSDTTMEMGGLTVENTFTFSVMNLPNLRWWVGPLLRFGYYSGETDYYIDSYGDLNKTEADLFEYGIGVATGYNFKVGRNLILAPSIGLRIIGVSGDGTVVDYDTGTRDKEDLSGSYSTLFFNFAMLFE